jgi:hypothetical protein
MYFLFGIACLRCQCPCKSELLANAYAELALCKVRLRHRPDLDLLHHFTYNVANTIMILGPVSYLDCLVFCLFLAPQLVWHVGLFETTLCALTALPFLGE